MGHLDSLEDSGVTVWKMKDTQDERHRLSERDTQSDETKIKLPAAVVDMAKYISFAVSSEV